MTSDRYRDRGLGTALRELEVPEHDEAFFTDLERRLTAERQERRPRRRLVLRPASGLRSSLVAAGGLCTAILLVAAIGSYELRSGSGVARAAVVRTKVMKTLAAVQTVRGELVYSAFDVRTGKAPTRRETFATNARGDLRLTDVGGPEDLAFDATHGVERAVTTSASMGQGRFFAERLGVAPGPPDRGPSDFILGRQLGAVVRALVAARRPDVANVKYDGRPAWRLDTPLEPNAVFPDADRLEVTVDQQTGFPVHVLTTLGGAFRSELRLDDLVVDEALPADEFTVQFPAGAEVLRTDEGFAHVSREDVARIVGYEPLVPTDVPQGFGLATVAVAREAAPTGAGESNPPSRDVVSLLYRRGLDQLVVTTRRRVAGEWTDPFATEGIRLPPERVEVAGALARAPADLVLSSRTVPHLWALTGRLVVTVSGDLDRAELLAVARSLR